MSPNSGSFLCLLEKTFFYLHEEIKSLFICINKYVTGKENFTDHLRGSQELLITESASRSHFRFPVPPVLLVGRGIAGMVFEIPLLVNPFGITVCHQYPLQVTSNLHAQVRSRISDQTALPVVQPLLVTFHSVAGKNFEIWMDVIDTGIVSPNLAVI